MEGPYSLNLGLHDAYMSPLSAASALPADGVVMRMGIKI